MACYEMQLKCRRFRGWGMSGGTGSGVGGPQHGPEFLDLNISNLRLCEGGEVGRRAGESRGKGEVQARGKQGHCRSMGIE